MAPTVVREGPFRLFFFSREEPRMHIHVAHPDGEAKFWLEPAISLASHTGLSSKELSDAEEIILLCYMQLWMEKAQQLSKQLYPVMRELNSDYYGKLFDLAYETRHITNRTRDTLLREAAKLDPANYTVHRARSMLAQLRARQFEF